MVKDLVRRGRRARDQGRWTEAHAAYKAAFEATDPASGTELERAEIAGELGLCELALRMYRDAAEHLAWSLEQREALPPAQQRRFGEGLRKTKPFVATLILAVDPPDAEVFVDGKAIGRTARTYKLFFEPGHHMVRARAPGHGESLHGLRAVAAAEHEISIKLLPDAAVRGAKDAAPAAPKLASASPPARAKDPGPSASWPATLRIAGIAVTTATLSAGSLLMIRATSLDGDLSERREGLNGGAASTGSRCWQAPEHPACAELRRLRDERNVSAGVGAAMLIAGGVIGAATAACFFMDFSFLGLTPAPDRVRASPVATGREIGVRVEGLW
ncbi:hypothetical protein [Sorangium sp. So ce1151]|uniref:hypothetical protein n=1 Tax=Sorangium sp. So ce1151 TaxID=3133332 RepID=UPI003F5EA457